MEATEVRTRLGGVTRLVAALVGLATPPALLAVVVGNPVPAWPIDWAHVVESIQAGLVPSSVWVNVLAVVAWVTWMVLVGMLAVEVVAIARHRPSAPAVPGWIRGLAQALVAAAIALAGPGQHTVAAVETAPPVVATAPAAHADGLLLAEGQSDIEGRFVTVGEGDSWSGFAAEVLGDASLGPRLREANLGRPVGNGSVPASTSGWSAGWAVECRPTVPGGMPGRWWRRRPAATAFTITSFRWTASAGCSFPTATTATPGTSRAATQIARPLATSDAPVPANK
jgi:hypothetical protein